MEEILIQGICLSAKPVGENDQLLTFFSGDAGILRIYARGILRPQKKALQLLTRPASVSELRLTRGRSELWNLADGHLLYYPDGLNHSWDQLQGALSMIRAVLETQWLGKPSPLLAELLLSFIRQIEISYHPSLLAVFYLKLLSHEGLFPFPKHCSVCGVTCEESLYFDLQGECLCKLHAPEGVLILAQSVHEIWRVGSLLRSFEAVRAWECPLPDLLEQCLERLGTPQGSKNICIGKT